MATPVTAAEREAVRKRALAAGKKPTTAGINATVARNRAASAEDVTFNPHTGQWTGTPAPSSVARKAAAEEAQAAANQAFWDEQGWRGNNPGPDYPRVTHPAPPSHVFSGGKAGYGAVGGVTSFGPVVRGSPKKRVRKTTAKKK
jgi:hypothetical protein